MTRPCRLFAVIYLSFCMVALALFPLSNAGLFGLEPDALSALWAVALAMPWPILASSLFSDTGTLFNLVLLALAMLVNAVVLLSLCRLVRRKFN